MCSLNLQPVEGRTVSQTGFCVQTSVYCAEFFVPDSAVLRNPEKELRRVRVKGIERVSSSLTVASNLSRGIATCQSLCEARALKTNKDPKRQILWLSPRLQMRE